MSHSVGNGSLRALWRAIWRLGVRGRRRGLFWRLVARALRRGTDLLPRAVTFAIVGESLIRYTEEVVLPRIDASLAELAAHPAVPEPPPPPAPAPSPAAYRERASSSSSSAS